MSKISLDGVHSLRLETDYFQSEKTIIIKNRGRLFQRVQKQLFNNKKNASNTTWRRSFSTPNYSQIYSWRRSTRRPNYHWHIMVGNKKRKNKWTRPLWWSYYILIVAISTKEFKISYCKHFYNSAEDQIVPLHTKNDLSEQKKAESAIQLIAPFVIIS